MSPIDIYLLYSIYWSVFVIKYFVTLSYNYLFLSPGRDFFHKSALTKALIVASLLFLYVVLLVEQLLGACLWYYDVNQCQILWPLITILQEGFLLGQIHSHVTNIVTDTQMNGVKEETVTCKLYNPCDH